MKTWIQLLAAVLLFLIVQRFCEEKTDGFTLLGISSDRPYEKAWETRPPTQGEEKEIGSALSQKYTYFGCGGQSFVFFSEDGKFAIKFFKQRIFRPPVVLNHLPLPSFLEKYRAKKNWVRKDKLERDFSSYKIALDDLEPETGMLYVHLNKTAHLGKKLKIADRLGIEHEIDLDQTDFIVQRKAELIYPKIYHLMQAGNLEESKRAITAVFELIAARCQKGFNDRDPNICTNCGLMNGKAIKIDVGRFVRDDSMKDPKKISKEIGRVSGSFREWIGMNYPALMDHFDAELARFCHDE